LSKATNIDYTSAGLPRHITDANNKQTTFTYDGRGNRTSIQDPVGDITQFRYDARNRVTLITYPDYSTTQIHYDSTRGRRDRVNDGGVTGTYSFIYDNMDRLTEADVAYNFLSGTKAVNYTYDAASNRTSVRDPKGTTTNYAYDVLNRLHTASQFFSAFTFEYDD